MEDFRYLNQSLFPAIRKLRHVRLPLRKRKPPNMECRDRQALPLSPARSTVLAPLHVLPPRTNIAHKAGALHPFRDAGVILPATTQEPRRRRREVKTLLPEKLSVMDGPASLEPQ